MVDVPRIAADEPLMRTADYFFGVIPRNPRRGRRPTSV
jgi:hypothetical protein